MVDTETFYYLIEMDYICPIRHKRTKETVYSLTDLPNKKDILDEVSSRFGVDTKSLKIIGKYSAESFHVLKTLAHEAVFSTYKNS
jgi:hypothetical protein